MLFTFLLPDVFKRLLSLEKAVSVNRRRQEIKTFTQIPRKAPLTAAQAVWHNAEHLCWFFRFVAISGFGEMFLMDFVTTRHTGTQNTCEPLCVLQNKIKKKTFLAGSCKTHTHSIPPSRKHTHTHTHRPVSPRGWHARRQRARCHGNQEGKVLKTLLSCNRHDDDHLNLRRRDEHEQTQSVSAVPR